MKEGIKFFIYRVQRQLVYAINSKSKTFMAFCFCFLLGVVLASFIILQPGVDRFFYLAAFDLLFFSLIFWRKRLLRFSFLCSLFLLLGLWRMAITIPDCSNSSRLCNYYNQKVELVGRISKEPDRRIERSYYILDVSEVNNKKVKGIIRISTRIYPEYNFGETLQVSCKLKKPENFPDSTFFYDKYLARQGIWSVCGFARITRINEATNLDLNKTVQINSSIYSRPLAIILRLKTKVATQIDLLWPEPQASFMAGLLYGSRAGLPAELSKNFNRTGVTHIIAISGYNITIIVVALMGVFIRLGLYRQQAFWVTIFGIAVFVIFTGASPSVTRAGIMGGIVLLAQYLGRLSRVGNVLVFTAALMSLVNPYILVWDAGFQLSFLATVGLVYLNPLLERVIARSLGSGVIASDCTECRNPIGQASRNSSGLRLYVRMIGELVRNDAIKNTLVPTMSAIIFTLPLILYQFGRLSIVAPLVNILILWIIPWLMLLGFIATVFSFIYFPLGQVAAFLSSFGLGYVIKVVEFFGNRLWSSMELQIPVWAMLLSYAVLLLMVYYNHKKVVARF